jgi:hypothetical protein
MKLIELNLFAWLVLLFSYLFFNAILDPSKAKVVFEEACFEKRRILNLKISMLDGHLCSSLLSEHILMEVAEVIKACTQFSRC